jgi:NADPH:quinone reductase
MKAIVIHEFGGPEVLTLEEVPDPTPGREEVVVRLKAIGVNPVETYQRAGGQGYTIPRPFTPGADGAGVVEAVGPDVIGFSPGDRVYVAGSQSGTYAELCRCASAQVHHLPAPISFEDGACLWINYGTAYRALFTRGAATAGDRVLIHGATGGVGIAAVQWARYRGLQTYATYGSPAGEAMLRDQGVDHRFNHSDDGHSRAILDATDGHGIDLIVEVLANVNLEDDLDMLAHGGRVVVVGSRGTIEITPRKLMAREAEVRGLMLYKASPREMAEIHASIDAAGNMGALRPVIQTSVPLAMAAEAHRIVMEEPSHGKVLLIP